MISHAFLFAGVSPYEIACWACGVGSLMYFSQRYAQLGCGAFVARSHESAQPVAPSFGMVSSAPKPAFFRLPVCNGQAEPTTASPFWNSDSSSDGRLQYFFTSGFCCLRRLTAASNCFWLSSKGSVMPRSGFVFDRYSAASAIWIGLFGIVTLPLYLLP